MRFLKSAMFLCALAVAWTASARADIPHNAVPQTNMLTWNVAGLKLGMSPTEAIAVAKSQHLLGAHPDVGYAPCEGTRIALIRKQKMDAGEAIIPEPRAYFEFRYHLKPPALCLYRAQARADEQMNMREYVVLSFAEDYPSHPADMRLVGISYFARMHSDADAQSFIAHAVRKYGMPTVLLGPAEGPVTAEYWKPNPGFLGGLYVSEACWSGWDFTKCGVPSAGSYGHQGFPDNPYVFLRFQVMANRDGEVDFVDGARLAKLEQTFKEAENAVHSGASSF